MTTNYSTSKRSALNSPVVSYCESCYFKYKLTTARVLTIEQYSNTAIEQKIWKIWFCGVKNFFHLLINNNSILLIHLLRNASSSHALFCLLTAKIKLNANRIYFMSPIPIDCIFTKFGFFAFYICWERTQLTNVLNRTKLMWIWTQLWSTATTLF